MEKKVWQAPEVIVVDLLETSSATGSGADNDSLSNVIS